MSALFNIAGGVRYHVRGWRYADTLWSPFRTALAGWLENWQPGGGKLVIVGPSAGYCLAMPWLARFDEIACIDPDPLARILFARRLKAAAPHVRLSWDRDDFLDERLPQRQLRRLERALARHPGAPVLFSNFLGQLRLLLQERNRDPGLALATWRSELVRKTLARRSWASFHDRLSGPLAPSFAPPFVAAARLSDDEIVTRFYPEPQRTVELGDHDTQDLFPSEREHAYFCWRLTPSWNHLIEATRA